MAKITRETMLVFASSAGANQLIEFGSLAGGTPVYLTPGGAAVASIQSLSNYLEGWFGGVVGSNLPSIQDLNSLCYLYAYQLAYLFQAGIAEWDSATTYYQNSFVQVSGVIYTSLIDNNLNNAPASSPSDWGSPFQPSASVFTTSGTFSVPAGVTSVQIEVDYNGPLDPNFSFNGFSTIDFFGLIDPTGSLWTWGNASAGSTGQGTNTSTSSPVKVLPPGDVRLRSYMPAADGGMIIDEFGGLYCWGPGINGSLGNGTDSVPQSVPVSVLGTTRFLRLLEGSGLNRNVGAFDVNNKLWMWGSNGNGQLGTGDTVNRSSPFMVLGGFTFSKAWVGCSTGSVAAIDSSGNGYAWGANANGQLGTGDIIPRSSPVLIVGSHTWKEIHLITPNNNAMIGLDTAGKIWGWGDNSKGTIGNGNNTTVSSPVAVVGPAATVVFQSLAEGMWEFTNDNDIVNAALDVNGNVWTWGINVNGTLGNNTTAPSSSPVQVVGGHTFSQLFVIGGSNVFALDASGNAWSWGDNKIGQIGNGVDPLSVAAYSSPVQVVGGHTFKKLFFTVNGNEPSVYGIDFFGQVWAWGYNGTGALGCGDTVSRSSPVMVTGPGKPYLMNPTPKLINMSVTAGASIPVVLGWACTFNGVVVGYMAKSLTIRYTG